jgi:hypothetical protein
MRSLYLFLLYWWRAKIAKWAISELIDDIVERAWAWAKANYDRATKRMNVTIDMVQREEKYHFIEISERQSTEFNASAKKYLLLCIVVGLIESFLLSQGVRYIFYNGKSLDDMKNTELLGLFGATITIMLISIALISRFLKLKNLGLVEQNNERFRILDKELKSSKFEFNAYLLLSILLTFLDRHFLRVGIKG